MKFFFKSFQDSKLKPDEELSRDFEIVTDMYDLEKDNGYTVQGKYKVGDHNTVTRPYWQGEIYSRMVTLKVK